MSSVSNKAINDYLSEKGIPHARGGYRYLMLALRGMLDGDVDRYQMKSVYEWVARKANSNADQVYRSIRLVVRKAEEPVPNKEFLMQALDELLLADDVNAEIF